MIIPIEMFGCQCDNCGKQWFDDNNGFVAFTDKNSMANNISDDDTWFVDSDHQEDKHYCPDCFSIDDKDNLVIKQIIKGGSK